MKHFYTNDTVQYKVQVKLLLLGCASDRYLKNVEIWHRTTAAVVVVAVTAVVWIFVTTAELF